jgi:hypothetical protein
MPVMVATSLMDCGWGRTLAGHDYQRRPFWFVLDDLD